MGEGVTASERERKRVGGDSGAAQDIFRGGYLLSLFLFILINFHHFISFCYSALTLYFSVFPLLFRCWPLFMCVRCFVSHVCVCVCVGVSVFVALFVFPLQLRCRRRRRFYLLFALLGNWNFFLSYTHTLAHTHTRTRRHTNRTPQTQLKLTRCFASALCPTKLVLM